MSRGMNKYFYIVVRIVLGLVFVYAGVLKILDPVAFAGSVAAYKILPYGLNYLVAAVLPWVETICGLLLVAGYRVKVAACIILVMNLVFMVALASTILRGLDIDCGCFKQGGDKTPAWLAILRDVLFLGAAILLVGKKEGKRRSGTLNFEL
jgi:putative oxidoreductase